MKRSHLVMIASATIAISASPILAAEALTAPRAPVLRPARAAVRATSSSAALAACNPGVDCYSIEIPVVARVQGTAFFRTAIDFSNNTNQNGVVARYQLSYTCVSTACSPQGGFYRTAEQSLTLDGLDNFHEDDIVQFLDNRNLLQPGAIQGTIGTLLVTFENLPSGAGWEANAYGRTYNRIVETDPTRGTVGFAYNGSLFFDSASSTLVATMRDTKAAPSVAGMLRTNLGVRNTDINGSGANVTVDLEFWDTATGQRVGNRIELPNIAPGELRQVSDVWLTAGIPSTVHSAIAFADVRNPTTTTPTIEGYVTIIDGQSTQDAAFFEMRCADTDPCGN
jgi:hypothetical protein